MTTPTILQLAAYLVALIGLAVPLGHYMARVYTGSARYAQRILGPVEHLAYRLAGVLADDEMSWRTYATNLLLFNLFGIIALFLLQRLQAHLPLNPASLPAVPPELAFNTAVSFVTNTNWQAYAGEATMSHLTQALGLTVQNFLSAASGMSVLVALVRGFTRRGSTTIGNVWVDLTRTTLYILVPLAFALALGLASQGVVQTFAASATVERLDSAPAEPRTQAIALGPVASQVAIKQLGTNGGGFFNANSAHPFENPTPLANFLQAVAILLIPAALCLSLGHLIGDRRQGRVLLAVMFGIFLPALVATTVLEQRGNPILTAAGADPNASPVSPGGNMEGKEVRFGIANSTLWAIATTAASNGSVNAMHDSFTPLAGMIPLWLIQLGEIVFGGVGSGLYGMLVYAILAVFLAGLMVGRTPEYLGKKIEAFDVRMAALVILLPAAATLAGTAVACVLPAGTAPLGNPAAHGFSEILYAFSSAANNNGSAFAGLTASGPFYSLALGLAMLVGRYWVIVPVLALAGSLASKPIIPPSSGTLPTHTPLFAALLSATILLVGALTFLPALALGPIVEELQSHDQASAPATRTILAE